MLQNVKRIYTLAPFSVERRSRGWYYGKHSDEKSAYKGPYSSVASVTLMIARQLRKETERRDKPYAIVSEKMPNMKEYEFRLKDGSKRYELVDLDADHNSVAHQLSTFMKMHDAVSAKPVEPGPRIFLASRK